MAVSGTIEVLGYFSPASGWLICGWFGVTPDLARGLPLDHLRCVIQGVQVAEPAHVAVFSRDDIADKGTGFLLYVRAAGSGLPPPFSTVNLWFGNHEFQLRTTATTAILSSPRLVDQCRLLLDSAFAGQTAALTKVLERQAFAGVTTVEDMPELLRMGVDELVPCEPAGAVLLGWRLAAPGTIKSIKLCWEHQELVLDPAGMAAIERRDVLETIGWQLGFEDSWCGFLVTLPTADIGSAPAHLEVQTRDGRVGYVAIPPRRLAGTAAIKRILGQLDLGGDAIRSAFDQGLGRSIDRLQIARLAEPLQSSTTTFGAPPANPRCSLIIPLFGRTDYLEYQVALLSADPSIACCDLIYVLDDPSRRGDTLALAHSVHARFGVPFRLMLLADNRGYASANNAAIGITRGEFVCFMNSDVFPHTPGFLDRLANALEHDPTLGAVGPVLLFEDGSVQHEGMTMHMPPGLGGLRFPIHPRKGRRPRDGAGLERCDAITGACLMVRRSVALELGGLDEGYVIGDFEDCDLCHRLGARGLGSAVDHGVRLYHLERQSQAGPNHTWRRNLTLYNAWRYNTRHVA